MRRGAGEEGERRRGVEERKRGGKEPEERWRR